MLTDFPVWKIFKLEGLNLEFPQKILFLSERCRFPSSVTGNMP